MAQNKTEVRDWIMSVFFLKKKKRKKIVIVTDKVRKGPFFRKEWIRRFKCLHVVHMRSFRI